MNIQIPKYLYRYTAIPKSGESGAIGKRKRLRSLLVHNEAYMVRPAWLNDAFDCSTMISALTARHFRQLADMMWQYEDSFKVEFFGKDVLARAWRLKHGTPDDLIHHMNKTLDRARHRMAILSFCERCDNPLMWAHYADGQRGLCWQFSTRHFKAAHSHLYAVKYFDRMPTGADLISHFKSYPVGRRGGILHSVKSQEWAYEREWRLVLFVQRAIKELSEPLVLPQGALSAVILGPDMDEITKLQVQKWLQKRASPVRVYEARKDHHNYSIVVDGMKG